VSSLSFQGNATLLTDPGPINVTLHYSCPPSVTNGTIQVEVLEGDEVEREEGRRELDGRALDLDG